MHASKLRAYLVDLAIARAPLAPHLVEALGEDQPEVANERQRWRACGAGRASEQGIMLQGQAGWLRKAHVAGTGRQVEQCTWDAAQAPALDRVEAIHQQLQLQKTSHNSGSCVLSLARGAQALLGPWRGRVIED